MIHVFGEETKNGIYLLYPLLITSLWSLESLVILVFCYTCYILFCLVVPNSVSSSSLVGALYHIVQVGAYTIGSCCARLEYACGIDQLSIKMVDEYNDSDGLSLKAYKKNFYYNNNKGFNEPCYKSIFHKKDDIVLKRQRGLLL
ncbi:hypothetical protein ACJX0J_013039 [Zea mays]